MTKSAATMRAPVPFTAPALARLLRTGETLHGYDHARHWFAQEIMDNKELYEALVNLLSSATSVSDTVPESDECGCDNCRRVTSE